MGPEEVPMVMPIALFGEDEDEDDGRLGWDARVILELLRSQIRRFCVPALSSPCKLSSSLMDVVGDGAHPLIHLL